MNPRKFSEKIALHTQKQAEETAAFEKIMKEVNLATKNKDITSNENVKINQNNIHMSSAAISSYAYPNNYLSPTTYPVSPNCSINSSDFYGGSLPNFYVNPTRMDDSDTANYEFLQHYSRGQSYFLNTKKCHNVAKHQQKEYSQKPKYPSKKSPTTSQPKKSNNVNNNVIQQPSIRRASLNNDQDTIIKMSGKGAKPQDIQIKDSKYQLDLSNAMDQQSYSQLPPNNFISKGSSYENDKNHLPVDLKEALKTLKNIKTEASQNTCQNFGPILKPSTSNQAQSSFKAQKARARSTHKHSDIPHTSGRTISQRRLRTDLSPYGSPYLSPPSPESSWRRANSDSALNTDSVEYQTPQKIIRPKYYKPTNQRDKNMPGLAIATGPYYNHSKEERPNLVIKHANQYASSKNVLFHDDDDDNHVYKDIWPPKLPRNIPACALKRKKSNSECHLPSCLTSTSASPFLLQRYYNVRNSTTNLSSRDTINQFSSNLVKRIQPLSACKKSPTDKYKTSPHSPISPSASPLVRDVSNVYLTDDIWPQGDIKSIHADTFSKLQCKPSNNYLDLEDVDMAKYKSPILHENESIIQYKLKQFMEARGVNMPLNKNCLKVAYRYLSSHDPMESNSSSPDLYRLCLCMNNLKSYFHPEKSSSQPPDVHGSNLLLNPDYAIPSIAQQNQQLSISSIGNLFPGVSNESLMSSSFQTSSENENVSGSLPDLSTLNFNLAQNQSPQINSNQNPQYVLPCNYDMSSIRFEKMTDPSLSYSKSFEHLGVSSQHNNQTNRLPPISNIVQGINDQGQQPNINGSQSVYFNLSLQNTLGQQMTCISQNPGFPQQPLQYYNDQHPDQSQNLNDVYKTDIQTLNTISNQNINFPPKTIQTSSEKYVSSSYNDKMDYNFLPYEQQRHGDFLDLEMHKGIDTDVRNQNMLRKFHSHDTNLDHTSLYSAARSPNFGDAWISSNSPSNSLQGACWSPEESNDDAVRNMSRQIMDSFHEATDTFNMMNLQNGADLSRQNSSGYLPHSSYNNRSSNSDNNNSHYTRLDNEFDSNSFFTFNHSQDNLSEYLTPLGGSFSNLNSSNNNSPNTSYNFVRHSQDSSILMSLAGDASAEHSSIMMDTNNYNQERGGLLEDLLTNKILDVPNYSENYIQNEGRHKTPEKDDHNIYRKSHTTPSSPNNLSNFLHSPDKQSFIHSPASHKSFTPNEIPHIILTGADEEKQPEDPKYFE